MIFLILIKAIFISIEEIHQNWKILSKLENYHEFSDTIKESNWLKVNFSNKFHQDFIKVFLIMRYST